jgi:two-component system, OmpR family, phosphate regulon response regulator PhoB
MKRILLVEDDQSLGATLNERLHKEGFEVELARSLNEARSALKKHFDLVILDVGLPDGSGLEFANEVKSKTQAPFLFMTAQSDAESRLKGYEAGAEEFIPKPFHLKEFLLRVNHVLENHVVSQIYKLQDQGAINFDSFYVELAGEKEPLSQKEALVLKTLITQAPKVVSRDELLNKVWGQESFPTQRTIDNVILRLRSVLGPYGSRIQSVRGVGYKWD